jgi:hypothetical protein
MNCSDISMADTAPRDGDYSPTTESFPYSNVYDTCYTDTYATQPITSLKFPEGFVQGYQVVSSSVVPNASLDPYRLSFDSTSFDRIEQFTTGFPFSPTTTDHFDTETTCISPYSLISDSSQLRGSNSPELPPLHLKGESASSRVKRTTTKPLPRKRGRPRLDRASPNSSISSHGSCKGPHTSRVPHNQVERKYREGLNFELERLRRTVPTLPQCTGARAVGQPQLSKVMVLVGAIEHIKTIEKQRDALIVENERLRGL